MRARLTTPVAFVALLGLVACGSQTTADLASVAANGPAPAVDAGTTSMGPPSVAQDAGTPPLDAADLVADASTVTEDAATIEPSSPPDASVMPMPASAHCVLLGADIDQPLSTTWSWDGASWTRLSPAMAPNARSNAPHAALAGDLVVFGGYAVLSASSLPPGVSGETTYVNDTWVFHGGTWTAPSTPTAPLARDAAAMATLGDKAVLFGGESPAATFGDTWTWDGAAWFELTPPTSPTPRARSMAATLNGKLVLFGGVTGQYSTALTVNETWEFDGTTWTQRTPTHAPSARGSAAMATVGDRIVLFGGQTQNAGYLGDTWVWDGDDWSQIETATEPSPRAYAATGGLGSTMVVAGGLGGGQTAEAQDTWVFDGAAWTQVAGAVPASLDAGFGAMGCF
jgi:hypothetical protein